MALFRSRYVQRQVEGAVRGASSQWLKIGMHSWAPKTHMFHRGQVNGTRNSHQHTNASVCGCSYSKPQFHASAMRKRRLSCVSGAAALRSREPSSSVPVQPDTEQGTSETTPTHSHVHITSRHVTSARRRLASAESMDKKKKKRIDLYAFLVRNLILERTLNDLFPDALAESEAADELKPFYSRLNSIKG